MLGRLLATVAVVFALGACGSRTSLRGYDDGSLYQSSQAGTGNTSGIGGTSGDGAGADGAGSGAAGMGAGDGSAGMSAGSSSAGNGGSGTAGAGGFPAGQGGASGMSIAGEGGVSGMAGEILNPHGCATPDPFVLSIDPVGTSGSVSGWLESAAGMVFEDQLPRFVRVFDLDTTVSDRSIALWWSIGSVGDDGEGDVFFYAGEDFTSVFTEVAIAQGANRFSDIDVDALAFSTQTIPAHTGSFVAFRNTLTGEVVALRVDEVVDAGATGDGFCASINARWLFLR